MSLVAFRRTLDAEQLLYVFIPVSEISIGVIAVYASLALAAVAALVVVP
jgi:hypothetical protein